MSVSSLPVLQLDQRTYDRALSCVHCGLCLAVCPTYLQTMHEAESPRGRIQLIRGLADGTVEATDSVRHHLDLCLDCRACETACPSGVVYHELIESARIGLHEKFLPPAPIRLLRRLQLEIVTHPTLLRLALLPGRLLQTFGLLKNLPAGPFWPRRLPRDATGQRATIAFFAGCASSVLSDSLNRKSVDLLAAAGAGVAAPPAQGCCGAIHYHNGLRPPAEEMARRNIDALMPEGGPKIDFIVSTAAGCGAMLREYDVLLRDDPRYAQRAREFASKVRDITEVLDQLGLPPRKPLKMTVTYHDACHLAHGQKVTAPPRRLLKSIPDLQLIPLSESDQCCGAAGTYFMTQPAMARKLAARKLANVSATGATVCVMGNIGCALHLRARARAAGQTITILHPVDLLHQSIFESEKMIGAGKAE